MYDLFIGVWTAKGDGAAGVRIFWLFGILLIGIDIGRWLAQHA